MVPATVARKTTKPQALTARGSVGDSRRMHDHQWGETASFQIPRQAAKRPGWRPSAPVCTVHGFGRNSPVVRPAGSVAGARNTAPTPGRRPLLAPQGGGARRLQSKLV